MDDDVNRFAREMSDAIAIAVAEHPRVEACRQKARAAGYEMRVTLEAVVGFVNRAQAKPQAQSQTPPKVSVPAHSLQPRHTLEVTANDRRFLRSLRIAAGEATEEVN